MKYKLYLVGGIIRDEFLGLKSKDVDYSVVLEDIDLPLDQAFDIFVKQIKSEGFDVKVEHPDVVTVRAMFPKDHKYSGVADFVLARKELYYPEGGRRPVCKLGTLEDDLIRRDFTLNAMAKGEDGEIIDLFGGYQDLMYGILKTPRDPYQTFKDDPLRIIRAMRFCITKELVLGAELRLAIMEIGMQGIEKVSVERVREELEKCFYYDTYRTLHYLNYFKEELKFDLAAYAFKDTGLRLEPTNKK
jgi:tRNA nucleotidyltransferase/poly(A) polymerase